jgi:hypothetical protein
MLVKNQTLETVYVSCVHRLLIVQSHIYKKRIHELMSPAYCKQPQTARQILLNLPQLFALFETYGLCSSNSLGTFSASLAQRFTWCSIRVLLMLDSGPTSCSSMQFKNLSISSRVVIAPSVTLTIPKSTPPSRTSSCWLQRKPSSNATLRSSGLNPRADAMPAGLQRLPVRTWML